MKKVFLCCLISLLWFTLSGCDNENAVSIQDFSKIMNPSQEFSISLGMTKNDLVSLMGEPHSTSSQNSNDEFYTYFDENLEKITLHFSNDTLCSIIVYSPLFETMDGVKPGMESSQLGDEWVITNQGSTRDYGIRAMDEEGQFISPNDRTLSAPIQELDIRDGLIVRLAIYVRALES